MPRDLKTQLLQDAVEAFEGAVGLRATVEPTSAPGAREKDQPDACVVIELDKRHYEYAAEIKSVDRLAVLGRIRSKPATVRRPTLLVARYVTPELANHCRAIGLEFLDAAGNAYLNRNGLFVYVTGGRPKRAANDATVRAFNASGLRLLFALLCRPDLVNTPYRDLARIAQVAVGVVGRVFLDLRTRGFLVGGDAPGQRRLVKTAALLDAWVTNYPLRLRPQLEPRRFRAVAADWWTHFDPARHHAFWGGEVAAERLTDHLRPAAFIIYSAADPKELVIPYRLRLDPTGNIEVLRVFWDPQITPPEPGVVPPLLAYADLLATLDARNHEAARILYERRIAPALTSP